MARLPSTNPRSLKPALGRTATAQTPLNIRGDVELDPELKEAIRTRLGRALDPFATRITRGSVRFHDVNGPRGGIDTMCRIKLVVTGEDDGILIEQIAEDARLAFSRALPRVTRAVRKLAERRGGRAPSATLRAPTRRTPSTSRRAKPKTLIGRTSGQSQKNLEMALDRPEKRRRDAYVDTSAPKTSASDRRAGGPHTARRNTKRRTRGMTSALEDSLKKPSRKSTRRSSNRQKSGTKLERRAASKTRSPKQRAVRATTGKR
ncbi:MAG: hypothetical protein HOW73_02690 [Polyangiaceae bacterium]|nr:hypothetical protein [Polyangiaceae bacterium]